MVSLVENLFQKNPLQDLLSSLNAVISTNESTESITGHVISNPAYTYKFQLKTTMVPNDLTYKFLEVQDLLWTLVAVHQQPLLPSGRVPLAPILERRNFYPLH